MTDVSAHREPFDFSTKDKKKKALRTVLRKEFEAAQCTAALTNMCRETHTESREPPEA